MPGFSFLHNSKPFRPFCYYVVISEKVSLQKTGKMGCLRFSLSSSTASEDQIASLPLATIPALSNDSARVWVDKTVFSSYSIRSTHTQLFTFR